LENIYNIGLEKLYYYVNVQFQPVCGRNYFFQDDNASVHAANDIQIWIQTNKVKILKEWPSQLPDLNLIEHLWSELERRLKNRKNHPENASELEIALKEEWQQILYEKLHTLIESMSKRIEACISNEWWPTEN
jgi:hypothetical protein